MQTSCAQCWKMFEISDDDLDAIAVLSPTVGGTALPFPPPTHCPECRQQRRYACRNDRNYYPNACMVCNKRAISSYSEDKPFGVLCDSCFWGDKWDPLSYSMEYDFNKPFFEQFAKLRTTVPRLTIYHTQCENSEYIVHSSKSRNCYMSSSVLDDEEVHYSDLAFESRNCMDLFSCRKMELCYECILCEECFQCEFCESCNNLSDCSLCFDCKSSDRLVGCIGQRNAKNKILNQDASKEQCMETISEFKSDPKFRKTFTEKFRQLKLSFPHRCTWMMNTENCTGNYIWNCKNVHQGFNVRNQEDTRYSYEELRHTTTCDTARVGEGEMLYECVSIVDAKYSAFCNLTYQSSHLLYCDNCNGTHNCFGSVSLKKHQWCIFNKQYTEVQYNNLVPKIIDHMKSTSEWGEFFPIAIAPFGYNESKAHEWYPLNREETLVKGWKWSDYRAPNVNVKKTIPANRLPEHIADIPDDILNWAILCEKSSVPFKIVKQELEFYRNRGLPVPHRSPKQRHYDRIGTTNIRTMYNRTCDKCSKEISTTYSPERPEKVYCETCYLAEVY